MIEWPHTVHRVSKHNYRKEVEKIMELFEPTKARSKTLTELPPVDNSKYESKSPMKYAVVYTLADEDGNVIHDTDFFISKDEAWDRAKELYEMSGLTGAITFREL